MKTNFVVYYGPIMWASTKFLPMEWAIVINICLALFCLYCIIVLSKKYREIKNSATADVESLIDEDEKPTKTQLTSAIAVNAIFFLLISGALIFSALRSNSVEDEIAQVNKECPVTVSAAGGETITYHSLDYDGDNIIVNIKLDSSDPEYVNFVKNLDNTDSQIRVTKFSLVYNSSAPYKLLADKYHKGVKANYFFNEIGDAITITIPYDEMVQINATPKEEAYLMELEQYIKYANTYLPDTIVDGFYTTRLFIEGNNVITELSFDDKKLDYNDYTSQPEELKKDADNALASSTDQNDPLFMLNGLTARCGKGIIKRIKTVYSNDSIDIVLTPEEVRTAFAKHLK